MLVEVTRAIERAEHDLPDQPTLKNLLTPSDDKDKEEMESHPPYRRRPVSRSPTQAARMTNTSARDQATRERHRDQAWMLDDIYAQTTGGVAPFSGAPGDDGSGDAVVTEDTKMMARRRARGQQQQQPPSRPR